VCEYLMFLSETSQPPQPRGVAGSVRVSGEICKDLSRGSQLSQASDWATSELMRRSMTLDDQPWRKVPSTFQLSIPRSEFDELSSVLLVAQTHQTHGHVWLCSHPRLAVALLVIHGLYRYVLKIACTTPLEDLVSNSFDFLLRGPRSVTRVFRTELVSLGNVDPFPGCSPNTYHPTGTFPRPKSQRYHA
jgi:hypothetical protein